ncbi:cupin domain-containing protein [Pseudonocardia asaccharolytica]|uniref:Cupin n=1 Tax=Pseudonocardia asaccharolytica DSM 44247 = NBRC 16224 TaxID=1123024 RepID=A0A511CZA9_9PSEU|nr:cupin domain-containing protein [Pseudonocardia asaccharolytica]GEL17880.1 cupin [Pseudonocardia asaccharolytica DSM 44247 = NBRC 16224]
MSGTAGVPAGYGREETRRPRLAIELDLTAHPEGGWYRRTWTSPMVVQTASGPRPSATMILYLLDGESRWHRVRSTELWCWHGGSPVALCLGGDGPVPADPTTVVLGPPGPGALPQRPVPPRRWQAARLLGPEPALVSCVVSPGFDFADFELLPGKQVVPDEPDT